MKKRIIFYSLIIALSFLLVGCVSKKADNYKETNDNKGILDMYDIYQLQTSDDYDVKECITCLNELGSEEEFCEGNGIITIDTKDVTLSESLNNKMLSTEQVKCLMDNGIVKHYRIPYLIYKIGEIIYSIFKTRIRKWVLYYLKIKIKIII